MTEDSGVDEDTDLDRQVGQARIATSSLVDELTIEHPAKTTVAHLSRRVSRPARLLTRHLRRVIPRPGARHAAAVLGARPTRARPPARAGPTTP
jgi:hypothetical protein